MSLDASHLQNASAASVYSANSGLLFMFNETVIYEIPLQLLFRTKLSAALISFCKGVFIIFKSGEQTEYGIQVLFLFQFCLWERFHHQKNI